jgi:hypothetical protein
MSAREIFDKRAKHYQQSPITISAEGITFHVAYSDLRNGWVIDVTPSRAERFEYGCEPTLVKAFEKAAQGL